MMAYAYDYYTSVHVISSQSFAPPRPVIDLDQRWRVCPSHSSCAGDSPRPRGSGACRASRAKGSNSHTSTSRHSGPYLLRARRHTAAVLPGAATATGARSGTASPAATTAAAAHPAEFADFSVTGAGCRRFAITHGQDIKIATNIAIFMFRSSVLLRGRPHSASAKRSSAPAARDSMLNSQRFTDIPPPKPVSEPSLPITRWQGNTIGKGLRPFAAPTARIALG